jgi:hypothetical protein
MGRREQFTVGELTVTNGIVLEANAFVNGGLNIKGGQNYFVDSVSGSDTNSGKFGSPLATIAAAITLAVAHDNIFIKGVFSEAVTLAVANVSIIGVGNGPYQARWTGAADAKCLTITANSCLVQNIRFQPPAYSAGIPCALYLNGATYTVIKENRFQGKTGSWYAIYTTGDCDNTEILDNDFLYMNTATYGTAIKSAGTADISGMIIQGNKFQSNLNHIVAPMKTSMIIGNILPAGGLAAAGTYSATLTVLGIDIHGAASGYNVVTQNHLGSLYHQACYYGGTGDEWSGNFCKDRSHGTQVDATTGLSILAPAA